MYGNSIPIKDCCVRAFWCGRFLCYIGCPYYTVVHIIMMSYINWLDIHNSFFLSGLFCFCVVFIFPCCCSWWWRRRIFPHQHNNLWMVQRNRPPPPPLTSIAHGLDTGGWGLPWYWGKFRFPPGMGTTNNIALGARHGGGWEGDDRFSTRGMIFEWLRWFSIPNNLFCCFVERRIWWFEPWIIIMFCGTPARRLSLLVVLLLCVQQ